MKTFYQLINIGFFILLFSSLSTAQTIYVDINASGNGDGTSWTDAFTNLQLAINEANGNEIWIAAGTYTPPATTLDTLNNFGVLNPMSMYGGFAGTETSIEERIPNENTTILSGDILGNDVADNFSVNKEDNIFHIMIVAVPVPGTILLDGITFQGGNTRAESDASDLSWRGGAIYSLSTINVNNCRFTNNFARSGGCIYLSPEENGGTGSTFTNCTFDTNSCVTQAAAIYINTIDDVTVSGCTFQNNITNRGTLYPLFCNDLLIEDCTFQNNISNDATRFGGGVFIWNSTGAMQNCTFLNNSSGNGGGVHIDGREMAESVAENFTFDNCTFSANSAQAFGGGGIRSFNASFTVNECNFLNNQAPNGGAIFNFGEGQEIKMTNNNFEGNSADFGGGHTCYGTFSTYSLTGNTYTGNAANTSGGASINGFGASVIIDDCDFSTNLANFGGALANQNDTTSLEVYNSSFVENSAAGGNGGAINITAPVTVTIDNCRFESNNAAFGGAINGSEGEVDVIEGFVNISNSFILLNTASTQGAGISIVDLDMEMTNTVVATNFNTGEGAGGGISLNTTAGKSSIFNITNTTIADNFALLGAGIGAFAENETSNCNINLQNTIFSNEGLNYEIEGGTPNVVSSGGNISTDATLDGILIGPFDAPVSDDIMFVDGPNYNFQLLDESPAINIGTFAGAPDTDILGMPRVGAPDAGAYENQNPLGIVIIENIDQLKMSPNPVQSQSTIRLSNSWNGEIQIVIMDQVGRVLNRSIQQKSSKDFEYTIDVSHLQAGNYILTLQSNNQKMTTSFVKI